jgi:DNA-binding transcriptional MerR regulator
MASAAGRWANLARPREVALALGIDGSTLRLWSKEFAELLSPAATRSPTADGAPAQRRYTEADLEVLRRIRTLLDQGLRYDEVRRRLRGDSTASDAPEAPAAGSDVPDSVDVVVASLRSILEAQQEALTEKDEIIQELVEDVRRLNQGMANRVAERDRAEADARRLRERLGRVERVLAEARRPWWKRLLGRG